MVSTAVKVLAAGFVVVAVAMVALTTYDAARGGAPGSWIFAVIWAAALVVIPGAVVRSARR